MRRFFTRVLKALLFKLKSTVELEPGFLLAGEGIFEPTELLESLGIPRNESPMLAAIL
jgi:hypothetical protein